MFPEHNNPIKDHQILSDAHANVSKDYLDQTFKISPHLPDTTCYICQQPPLYKLIPKSGEYPNAFMEDKGYVCTHHLQFVDKDLWSLKPLKGSR